MNIIRTVTAVAFAAVLISGCSSTDEKDGSLTDGGDGADISGSGGASTKGYPDGSPIGAAEIEDINPEGDALGGAFDDPRSPLSKQTIYFEYDSSQVKQEFMPVVYAHAGYLMAHPRQRIVLQGHADERGTREYNVALAEQRSKSVARLMQMQGVATGQMDIVSYGEEKPAVFGHNSAAWQQNRRVEIMYLSQ